MQGRISWNQLAALTSAQPARLFGLADKGRLAVGADADVVLYDPRVSDVIAADTLHNIAGYTPYEGWTVQGAVRDVFVRSRQVVRDGVFAPAPGWGRFVAGSM
jgi:dihydropyrimidinase